MSSSVPRAMLFSHPEDHGKRCPACYGSFGGSGLRCVWWRLRCLSCSRNYLPRVLWFAARTVNCAQDTASDWIHLCATSYAQAVLWAPSKIKSGLDICRSDVGIISSGARVEKIRNVLRAHAVDV